MNSAMTVLPFDSYKYIMNRVGYLLEKANWDIRCCENWKEYQYIQM